MGHPVPVCPGTSRPLETLAWIRSMNQQAGKTFIKIGFSKKKEKKNRVGKCPNFFRGGQRPKFFRVGQRPTFFWEGQCRNFFRGGQCLKFFRGGQRPKFVQGGQCPEN